MFLYEFILLIFSGKGLVQSQTSANKTKKINNINKEEYLISQSFIY